MKGVFILEGDLRKKEKALLKAAREYMEAYRAKRGYKLNLGLWLRGSKGTQLVMVDANTDTHAREALSALPCNTFQIPEVEE